DSRGFLEGGHFGRRWLVNPLMIIPFQNLNVMRPVDDILGDALLAFQLGQPSANAFRGIVVVGEKKAREHSRISAKPPVIVGDSPHENESEASVPRYAPHAFGMGELGLDGPDSGHWRPCQFPCRRVR